MLKSIYSCFRLVRSIHHGLYDAWLFGFFANDDPSTLVKPEYIATVMVGKSIADRFIKNSGATGLSLKLEEKANIVATHCFGVPPFPLIQQTLPSRSRRNGHEKIDVTIFSNKITYLKVSRAVIEIKIACLPCNLKDDLLRNKRLMELSDTKSNNYLQISAYQ